MRKEDDRFRAALTFMVDGAGTLDEEHADDAPGGLFLPAHLADTLWYFSGRGVVPVGHMSPLQAYAALCMALRAAARWGALAKLPRKARHAQPRAAPRWLGLGLGRDGVAGGQGAAGEGEVCSADGGCVAEHDDYAVTEEVLTLFVTAATGLSSFFRAHSFHDWFERVAHKESGMLAVSTVYRFDFAECQALAVALSYNEAEPGMRYDPKPQWLADADLEEFVETVASYWRNKET